MKTLMSNIPTAPLTTTHITVEPIITMEAMTPPITMATIITLPSHQAITQLGMDTMMELPEPVLTTTTVMVLMILDTHMIPRLMESTPHHTATPATLTTPPPPRMTTVTAGIRITATQAIATVAAIVHHTPMIMTTAIPTTHTAHLHTHTIPTITTITTESDSGSKMSNPRNCEIFRVFF